MQVYFKRTLVWPGYITHKFDKKCIYPELQSKIGKNGSTPPRLTLHMKLISAEILKKSIGFYKNNKK